MQEGDTNSNSKSVVELQDIDFRPKKNQGSEPIAPHRHITTDMSLTIPEQMSSGGSSIIEVRGDDGFCSPD